MQQLFRPSRLAMLVALAAAPAWVQAAYPAYKSGTAYKAGDIVSNVGALYECKEFPYSGWCGASPYHYERGLVWSGQMPGSPMVARCLLLRSVWQSAHRLPVPASTKEPAWRWQ